MDGVPRRSWYSFDQPWKDERLSLPWSYLVALNQGPLNWESCTLNYCPRYQCHVQGLFSNNVWLALAAICLIKQQWHCCLIKNTITLCVIQVAYFEWFLMFFSELEYAHKYQNNSLKICLGMALNTTD